MTRLAPSLAVAVATLMLAAPAFAADFSGSSDAGFSNSDSGLSGSPDASDDTLRSGFSDDDWANSDKNDPLSFELGLRYWYSWGAQHFNLNGPSLTDSDNTQSVEAHIRVDDASSGYYAKALAGTSFDINGTSSGGPPGQPNTVTDGRVTYAGGDIGFSWLGANSKTKFGPFAGYMYWNDSPNLGRSNFYPTADSGNSVEDDVNVNALRLGLSGKVDLGSYIDVSVEVAAVPYAKVGGTLGAFGFTPQALTATTILEPASAVSMDGWGYGAMGEAMIGFHPTSNMVLRVGGRAWYLQGRSDETLTENVVDTSGSTPTVTKTQDVISTSNPWSLFRYGLLTELTYSF